MFKFVGLDKLADLTSMPNNLLGSFQNFFNVTKGFSDDSDYTSDKSSSNRQATTTTAAAAVGSTTQPQFQPSPQLAQPSTTTTSQRLKDNPLSARAPRRLPTQPSISQQQPPPPPPLLQQADNNATGNRYSIGMTGDASSSKPSSHRNSMAFMGQIRTPRKSNQFTNDNDDPDSELKNYFNPTAQASSNNNMPGDYPSRKQSQPHRNNSKIGAQIDSRRQSSAIANSNYYRSSSPSSPVDNFRSAVASKQPGDNKTTTTTTSNSDNYDNDEEDQLSYTSRPRSKQQTRASVVPSSAKRQSASQFHPIGSNESSFYHQYNNDDNNDEAMYLAKSGPSDSANDNIYHNELNSPSIQHKQQRDLSNEVPPNAARKRWIDAYDIIRRQLPSVSCTLFLFFSLPYELFC